MLALESNRTFTLTPKRVEFIVGVAHQFNGAVFRPRNVKVVCRCYTEEFKEPIGLLDALRVLMRAKGKIKRINGRHRR